MAVGNETGVAVPGAGIAPGTVIGTVRLTVSDLERSRAFYERMLGMEARSREDGALALGVPGDASGRPLLELRGDPSAPPHDPRLTGLFHFAVLVPDRRALAVALARLATHRWPLSGASDHLVSEALYLNDPDGNGIEIYRDRPRSEWPRATEGAIRMATLPLDLDGLVAELGGVGPRGFDLGADAGLPPGTTIGHVHLQVSDLAAVERFYSGVLGFDVMVRGYPGALFVAAGGYHHHIGLNTWHSAGAGAPPVGALGLRSFEVRVGGTEQLDAVLARVAAAGLPGERLDGGTLVRDPSGNGVLLRI